MQDDVKDNEIKQKDDAENNASITRRRFTQASMVAPIVMSLASRPVLGQGNQCTTSGLESGNHSGVNEVSCEGCSPGYWINHPDSWSTSGYNPSETFDFNNPNDPNNGTLFSQVFNISNQSPYWGLTLMQVLKLKGNADPHELGFHTVATLLNAAVIGPPTFGYTKSEVITIYNTWNGTAEELKFKFENLHDDSKLYPWITCPLN